MRLEDFGELPDRSWFQSIFDTMRNGISFEENVDGEFLKTYIDTTETVVSHTLGRIPTYIIEVASYPTGTAGINFTQAPTNERLFLKRNVAGHCTLFIM